MGYFVCLFLTIEESFGFVGYSFTMLKLINEEYGTHLLSKKERVIAERTWKDYKLNFETDAVADTSGIALYATNVSYLETTNNRVQIRSC